MYLCYMHKWYWNTLLAFVIVPAHRPGTMLYYILEQSIYIKLKSHPSVCLSVCLSVTLLTRLELLTWTYQLPNTINPSSSYFKFVTASKCGDQIAFCSGLKTKKWRKLKQHSIENHSRMAQWVEQLTCIQEVAGSNPAGERIFFLRKSILFAYTFFLKFSSVTWHYKHASKRDLSEIERTSSGNSDMLIANW